VPDEHQWRGDIPGREARLTRLNRPDSPVCRGFVGVTCPVLSTPRSGVPTELTWPGDSAADGRPFPRLLLRISHIVVLATRADFLVTEMDGAFGTKFLLKAAGCRSRHAQDSRRKSLSIACGVLHDVIVFTEDDVRELVRQWVSPVVTSLYLDVDGRQYPRRSDLVPHLNRLFDVARASAEAQGPDAVGAVDRDIRRIASWMGRDLDRTTTRGVAAFSCDALGRFEAFPLSRPVRDQVVVGPGPDIAQLCAALSWEQRTLVVAVDRQASKLVRLNGDEVDEFAAPVDTIERQVDTDVEIGSFDRRHEELARQHYRHVARAVAAAVDSWRPTAVVLSGQDDSVSQLERYLPDRASSLVKGRLRLPVVSSTTEFATHAHEAVSEAEKARRHGLVQELGERAAGDAGDAGAVVGPGPVLEALGTGRVATLVVEEGFDLPGIRCPDCGRLASDGIRCPRCGATPIAVEHLIDAAVNEAFAHHVRIEFLESAGLDGFGHIGALIG